jgi:hypothetical protein
MSSKLHYENTIENLALTSNDSDEGLTKRVEKEKIGKELKSAARLLSIVAIGSVVGTTLMVNAPSIHEGFRAVTSDDEVENSVSETASYFADSTIYVNCDNDLLKRFDEDDPRTKDSEVISRAGAVRKINGPFGFSFYPPVTTLREDICSSIADYDPLLAEEDSKNTLNYALGLTVLLHEIEHTKEIGSEAQASCYAHQKLPGALKASGVDSAYAEELSSKITNETSHFLLPEYLSDECKPGGAYDLDIGGNYLIPPSSNPHPS